MSAAPDHGAIVAKLAAAREAAQRANVAWKQAVASLDELAATFAAYTLLTEDAVDGQNVKPAPFALNEASVAAMLNGASARGLVDVVVEAIKLVDQPAPANAIDPIIWEAFVADFSRPTQPGVASCYERAKWLAKGKGLSIPAAEVFRRRLISEGFQEPAKLAAVPRPKSAPVERPEAPPPPGATDRIERRRDVNYRRQQAREERELEATVDGKIKAERLQLIRNAGTALKRRPQSESENPRPVPGARAPKPAKKLPPLPYEQQLRQLDCAIRFLKRQGVLVSVVNRDALIRTYRVTGKRENKLAGEVIQIAVDRGFDPDLAGA